MRAQKGDTLRIQLIQTPRTGFAIGDQTRVFEHTEVLRDRGPADRQLSGKLIYGDRAISELLKDGHAGGIAQGVEPGL